jgi:hypothetical protein
MIREKVSIEQALTVLNRALQADRGAVKSLFDFRVDCNSELAEDPEIQIGFYWAKAPTMSVLGLLNGIFGEEDGWGAISAVYKLECSGNKDHEVDEGKRIMDGCEKCGSQIVLGDIVKFERTPATL